MSTETLTSFTVEPYNSFSETWLCLFTHFEQLD
jgi:hypothetical protein